MGTRALDHRDGARVSFSFFISQIGERGQGARPVSAGQPPARTRHSRAELDLAAHGVSTVVDLLAHEYGWTHQVILEEMTRAQVEVYLAAISRRYKRESDAMKDATKGQSAG